MPRNQKCALYEEVLRDYKRRRSELEDELGQLEAAESVARRTLQQLQSAGSNGAFLEKPEEIDTEALREELKRATKHEAAEIVLEKIGRPANVPEIVALLESAKYSRKLGHRILHNGIHVAMNRKSETFSKIGEGKNSKWALKKWGKKPPDK